MMNSVLRSIRSIEVHSLYILGMACTVAAVMPQRTPPHALGPGSS